jgi:hypothetical protein
VAVVFSFAGAAGCVATLLHDAAMNPAEGKDPSAVFWAAESSCLVLVLVLSRKENRGTIFVANPLICTTRWRSLPPHVQDLRGLASVTEAA